MKTSIYIMLISIFVATDVIAQQHTNTEVKAKIIIEENSDFISITGYAENLTDAYKSLHYKLSVIKSGDGNNKSTNNQGGRFTLEANQIKSLSKTEVNLSKNQTVILLLIYDENQNLVGKDRVVIGEKKNDSSSSQTTKKANDGIEITGIVSDETRTKMGKEFYDAYYSEYSQLKSNSSKMIVVEEELTNTRTTKIKVRVENEIISEFITKPDVEYLASMAEDSAAKTFNYLKKIEKQSNYVFQY